MVGVGLLALSLAPQQAFGTNLKQKQRAACRGMRAGDVSRTGSHIFTFTVVLSDVSSEESVKLYKNRHASELVSRTSYRSVLVKK